MLRPRFVAPMHVIKTTLHSDLLNNDRRVWLQRPSIDRPAQAACILLDGEYYVERMGVPALVAELQRSKAIPPLAVISVSHVDVQTRWFEPFCPVHFARFISEQLVPWTRDQCRSSNLTKITLGGLSLTGLAAAHAALVFPGTFSGVLCQSASFWRCEQRIHSIRVARRGSKKPHDKVS
jgi:enterochelin esterase-like enzyme